MAFPAIYAALSIAAERFPRETGSSPVSPRLARNRKRENQMTVLVTGGAGYIGSHMVHALADASEPVVVLDNLSTGFRSALPSSVPLFIGDVGDQDLVASIIDDHRISAIIHFAGSIVVPESVRDPLGYYRNNTVNTR